MDFKRKLFRNMNWNWAGTLGDAAVAFLLCPFLLKYMGATNYGAWVMVGSLAGYFGLLDLGIRASVGRYVAFYRARQDSQAVSEIVSTAIALLTVAGVLAMVGVGVISIWAERLCGSDLDPADLPALRWAIWLAGLSLGLQLPLRVADGVLWGCERFDHLNAVSIPLDLARGVCSALVVFFGFGLIGLSAVGLALTILHGVLKFVLAQRAEPALAKKLGRVSRQRVGEVFSFGFWNTFRAFTAMIPTRITPLLVGVMLSVSLVAPLSVAARLIAVATAIVVAAAGVVVPMATAMHAREDRSLQQDLLVEGGKYSLAAATVLLALFVLLGKPLIHLWVGPTMAAAYPLLVLMAVGRWISMSQVVTRGMITAKAMHRTLALATVVQAAGTVVLGVMLSGRWGVVGVVAAVAVFDALCEGVFSWIYGCRLMEMSPVRYAIRIAGPTAKALTVPCLLLAGATWLRPVSSWLELVIYGSTFSLFSVAAVVAVNEGPSRCWAWLTRRGQREPISCAI